MKFGDGCTIKYEGKGTTLVNCSNGEVMELEDVLYIPNLKENILTLTKFNDQGCTKNLGK